MNLPRLHRGTTIGIADGVPATLDKDGYIAQQFFNTSCVIHEVPKVSRKWGTVRAELVGLTDEAQLKAGAAWNQPTFTLNRILDDETQELYRTYEAHPTSVTAFVITSAYGDRIYFTAQVLEFSLVDGGGKSSIDTATVTLAIQQSPIHVGAEDELIYPVPQPISTFLRATAGTLTISRIETDDGSPVTIIWPDGTQEVVQSGGNASSDQPAGNVVVVRDGRASVTRIDISGPFSFDIAVLSNFGNIDRITANNQNKLFGDIASLPITMTYFYCVGSNTVHGDIGDLKEALTLYFVGGQNTTHGNIADIKTALVFYFNGGQNTTHGDIADVHPSLNYYLNNGSNTVTVTSVPPFPTFRRFYQRGVGFTQEAVDILLAGLDLVPVWTVNQEINLLGNNAAPSSASDAAIASLTAKGVTVLTN